MLYQTLFFRKFGKMLQNLPSAVVVIGALRVKIFVLSFFFLSGRFTQVILYFNLNILASECVFFTF